MARLATSSEILFVYLLLLTALRHFWSVLSVQLRIIRYPNFVTIGQGLVVV